MTPFCQRLYYMLKQLHIYVISLYSYWNANLPRFFRGGWTRVSSIISMSSVISFGGELVDAAGWTVDPARWMGDGREEPGDGGGSCTVGEGGSSASIRGSVGESASSALSDKTRLMRWCALHSLQYRCQISPQMALSLWLTSPRNVIFGILPFRMRHFSHGTSSSLSVVTSSSEVDPLPRRPVDADPLDDPFLSRLLLPVRKIWNKHKN